jgi:ribosome-associated protein
VTDKTNNDPEQKDTIAPKEWTLEIAQLISDRHGYDIVILQVGKISPITDYLLIATGTSDRQLVSIADELKRLGKKRGNKVWKVAGMDSGDWVVLDFVDVVVHLFSEDLRKYYDLELIWGEAPRIEWESDEPSENA